MAHCPMSLVILMLKSLSTEMPLTNKEYRELCEEIDPLAESTEHGIDIYLNCLQFVRRKLSTHVV